MATKTEPVSTGFKNQTNEELYTDIKIIDYLITDINNGIKRYDNSIDENSIREVSRVTSLSEVRRSILTELENRIKSLHEIVK